jgi:spermidine synthase
MSAAGVFLVSAGALAFEVLLARVLAVSQWNHLAFMVIGAALLGGAAGGSLLSLRRPPPAPRPADAWLMQASLTGFAAACLLAFAALNRFLPLDYFKLPIDPWQWLALGAATLLSALPFLFAGVAVSLAFAAAADRPGPVYFAAMAGSALGALAPVPLTALLGEARALALAALLPLPPALIGSMMHLRRAGDGGRRAPALILLGAGLAAAGLGAAIMAAPIDGLRELRFSDYKALSHSRKVPGHRLVESVNGIRGRLDRVAGAHLRFAPGLSLAYTGRIPEAQAVFIDGDKPFYLYTGEPAARDAAARATLSYAGYALIGRPERVLVLAAGGGLAVACALASGAASLTIVHPDPRIAAMIGRHYGWAAVGEDPRAFLARSRAAYDLIQVENWGASIPGAGALDQDHTLTIDAFRACLERLAPGGVLVLSRHLLLPPSDDLRLFAAARAALERIGAGRPERCLALLRNWNTATLVVGRRPFPSTEPLREFARRGGFDIIFLDGADASAANRFNVFERPFHFEANRRLAEALAAGRAGEFYADYLLDVAPQGDERPFPGRFLKWTRIGDLYAALGRRPQALFLSGEAVLAALFVEALVISLLLLGLPAAAAARRGGRPQVRPTIVFFGIGAGFMLVELFFIHAGALFIGDAVTSMAVALAAILAASGASGLFSQRLKAAHLPAALAAALAAPIAAAALLALVREPLLTLSPGWRTAIFAAVAALPGAALGLPFPMGMRHLLPRPADRTFAWAVNGCAAVLASVAGAAVALSLGLGWLLTAAALAYAAALAGAFPRRRAAIPRGA